MNRLLLTVLILVVAVAWAAALVARGEQVGASFFSPVSIAVSVASGAIFAFDRWGWRLVGPLLGRPVIDGTYLGVLKSSWVDPKTHQATPPIEVAFIVTQTFSSVAFRLMTAESQSVTRSASIVPEPDERHALLGVYENVPRPGVRDRSQPHAGAARLTIETDGAVRLTGSYWTDRHTFGELTLKRVSAKRAHSLETARALKAA